MMAPGRTFSTKMLFCRTISSPAGDRGVPGSGHYAAAKAGVNSLTKTLSLELAPAIRVNGVSPGAILWPEHEMDEAARKAILDKTVMGRPGEAADIATAVAYLALDAPYVTGQILVFFVIAVAAAADAREALPRLTQLGRA